MRRLIPLILALLLLAACGAEAPPTAEPTPEPTPTPTAEPTPTPTVEPTLEPLPESAPASLPDAGFEPESFWLAEAEAAAEGEALTLEYAESWDSPRPERYRCIYGGDIGLVGYWDAHDASRGGPDVSVSDGWTITRFIFNEDDRVCKIEFWASVD